MTEDSDLEWNVHYWLGRKSSEDQKNLVTVKAVELDNHLKEMPVQYREVQYHESEEFKSLFTNRIK